MRIMQRTIFIMALLLLAAGLAMQPDSVQAQGGDELTDHSEFEELQVEFASGPEVTAACLECHKSEGRDIMETTHWTWEYASESGQQLGKNNVINNYCVAVASNEPRCTSCHIGYNYKDGSFDFTVMENIDCLVCHDTTGTYMKFPTAAGHPTYEDKEFPAGSGMIWTPPDLSYVAQNVSMPTRENCGACHFNGGGAPGVKHGDLDPTMANPSFELDVHMDADGLNYTCQECHVTDDHNIAGSHYDMTVGESDSDLLTCMSCHESPVHEDEDINEHTDRVACQTCHIPEVAREFPTKTWWDWSSAGQKNDEGKPYAVKDDNGWVTYHTKKGTFEWEMNLVPEYHWFNGHTTWIEIDDTIDPDVTEINTLHGDIGDAEALIFPVKAFRGNQMYDVGNKTLAVPHLFGKDENAYWKSWDWNLSITAGMEAYGADYSGEYGWAETVMYWPLTHMVAPAEDALECESCHTAEGGRLDFAALGYDADMVAMLTTFPPEMPEPVDEEKATAPEAEAEEAAESEPAEAPEESAEEAESQSILSNPFLWGAVVIVVVGLFLYLRKKD